ncbi:hypothetical protein FM21_31205 [Streptomyces mutabilis]|uniref:Amino acid permease n=1 Tax=Streptomyces mutabilis TaxID=67332 RepID=A0A086MT08_9ACTN|nr:hypothetical protein FM21_31205 [Streptomyces mutabilis]
MSQATASGTDGEAPPAAKPPLFTLTAMVVGSMVGAGVFSLPGRLAEETGVAGALIGWGRRLFSPSELVVLAVSVAGAVLGVVALAAGWISL